jgi:hypothetical protein
VSTIKNSRRVRFGYKIRKKIFIFAIQKSLRAFLNCVFTGRAVRIKGICCRCHLAGAIRAARLENAGFRTDLFRENAFGAFRVCVAMKAPVGLLSGERSASADGGALPRQVQQSATNAK